MIVDQVADLLSFIAVHHHSDAVVLVELRNERSEAAVRQVEWITAFHTTALVDDPHEVARLRCAEHFVLALALLAAGVLVRHAVAVVVAVLGVRVALRSAAVDPVASDACLHAFAAERSAVLCEVLVGVAVEIVIHVVADLRRRLGRRDDLGDRLARLFAGRRRGDVHRHAHADKSSEERQEEQSPP